MNTGTLNRLNLLHNLLISSLIPLVQLSAVAAPGDLNLFATTPGGGVVSRDPLLDKYQSNQLVTVTAIPAFGWTFLGWQGDATGTNPVLNLTVNRDTCVQAVFGTPVNQVVTTSGSLLLQPQAAVYPYATPLQLAAQPQPGFYFVHWTNLLIGGQNPRTYILAATNPSIAAVFAPLSAGEYALTAIPNGLGSVTIDPQTNRFANGTIAMLTAVPDPGQTFTGWSGDAAGTDNPVPVTMDRNRIIRANFTRRPRLETVDCLGQYRTAPFTLLLQGELGFRYEIQRSTNFATWTPVGSVTNSLNITPFTDSAQPPSQSYYRAVLVP